MHGIQEGERNVHRHGNTWSRQDPSHHHGQRERLCVSPRDVSGARLQEEIIERTVFKTYRSALYVRLIGVYNSSGLVYYMSAFEYSMCYMSTLNMI